MFLLLFEVFAHPLRLFEQEIPMRLGAFRIGAQWQAHFRPKALRNRSVVFAQLKTLTHLLPQLCYSRQHRQFLLRRIASIACLWLLLVSSTRLRLCIEIASQHIHINKPQVAAVVH